MSRTSGCAALSSRKLRHPRIKARLHCIERILRGVVLTTLLCPLQGFAATLEEILLRSAPLSGLHSRILHKLRKSFALA